MDDMDPKDLEQDTDSRSYKAMLTRDRRRWSVADRNGDDFLNKTEFVEFLHPEEVRLIHRQINYGLYKLIQHNVLESTYA